MNVAARAAGLVLRGLPSPIPRRQRRLTGRHAVVDGVPFVLPIDSVDTPALMAGFTVDADAAAALLPGGEVHPLRLPGGRGVLVVTVINYRSTDIGRYIEFSIALACTHGRRPAPPILGALPWFFGTGQYVLDLPVSTEVSVKGGKGIWGMPKHQAPLDFVVDGTVDGGEAGAVPPGATVSSQYDHDGMLALRVDIARPSFGPLPVKAGGVNYCAFRGMLMRSRVWFTGDAYVAMGRRASGRLVVGDAPRVKFLHDLDIAESPLFTFYLPSTRGGLDDRVEAWFLTSPKPVTAPMEGLESVVDLGTGEDWPPGPVRHDR
ncbi:MAG: acetoacetate decarboxylase family protein [Actinomycetes bacterium]